MVKSGPWPNPQAGATRHASAARTREVRRIGQPPPAVVAAALARRAERNLMLGIGTRRKRFRSRRGGTLGISVLYGCSSESLVNDASTRVWSGWALAS